MCMRLASGLESRVLKACVLRLMAGPASGCNRRRSFITNDKLFGSANRWPLCDITACVNRSSNSRENSIGFFMTIGLIFIQLVNRVAAYRKHHNAEHQKQDQVHRRFLPG